MKRVASLDEIAEGKLVVVRSGSSEFLLSLNGGRVTACGNVCPHYGARLYGGSLDDEKNDVHGDVPFFWTELGHETVRVIGRYDSQRSVTDIEHPILENMEQ